MKTKKSASRTIFVLLCAFASLLEASAQTPIRVSGDSAFRYAPSITDSNTQQSVQFIRGDFTTFDVALFDNGILHSNLSRFTSISLAVFGAQNDTNPPQMLLSVTNVFSVPYFNTNTLTAAQWSNNPSGSTNYSAEFNFTDAQTSISLNSQPSASFWLRLFATTTDSIPRVVTYLEAPITVYDGPISPSYIQPSWYFGVFTDVNGNLISPADLWTQNEAGIAAALTAGGFSGGGGGGGGGTAITNNQGNSGPATTGGFEVSNVWVIGAPGPGSGILSTATGIIDYGYGWFNSLIVTNSAGSSIPGAAITGTVPAAAMPLAILTNSSGQISNTPWFPFTNGFASYGFTSNSMTFNWTNGNSIIISNNGQIYTNGVLFTGGGGGGGGTIYAGTNVTLTTTNVGTNTYQVVNTLTTPFFEATDYGCVGDNATDNSLAMSNLFNLASVKGGTVHFKAGAYRTQGGHFITNNITILGDGMVLDTLGNTDLNGTVIYIIANTTSNLFTFTGTNGFIHNITLYDGVPGRTNRSFVVVSNLNNSAGAKVDFDRVMFAGGWNGVTIQRQYYINFHNCTFHDWLHDGIMFSNSVDQDYGGMLIDNCAFLEENYASEAGLHFYGCGETHIVNCAWNNADASQTSYTNCIRIDFATANMGGWYGTSSLTIMGCLFNGSVGDCIYGDSPGTGTWEDLRIIGNEFNNTHGGWTNNGVQFYPLHLTQGIGINSIAADNSMVDTYGSGNDFALLKGVTNFFFGTIQSDLPLNTPGASLNVWKDDGQNQGIHIAGLINGGFTNDYYQTPLFTGNITITNVGSANTLIHIPALSYFDTVVYSNNVYTADEMWMGFDSLSGTPSPWQVDNERVSIGTNVTAMSMDYAGNMHINNGLGITGFLTLGGPFSTAGLTNFNTSTGMTPTGQWFINQLTLANGHTSTGGGDTNLFLGFFGNLTGTASGNPTPTQLAAQGTAVTNALAVQGTAVTNCIAGVATPLINSLNVQGAAVTNALAAQGTAVTNALAVQGASVTNALAVQGTAVTNALAVQGTANSNYFLNAGSSLNASYLNTGTVPAAAMPLAILTNSSGQISNTPWFPFTNGFASYGFTSNSMTFNWTNGNSIIISNNGQIYTNGVLFTGGSGGGDGSQTPIAQDVNYSGYSALQVGTLQLSNAVGSNALSAGGFTNNTVSATSYLFGTNSSLQASNVTVNGGGFLSTFPGNYSTTNWVGTNVYDYWWTNTSAANGGKVQFFTNYSTASFTWKVQALTCEVCRTNPIQAYSWQWTEYIVTNSSSGCGAVLTNTIGAYSHAGGLQSLATSATTDPGFGLYFGLNGTNTLSDLVHVTVIMP